MIYPAFLLAPCAIFSSISVILCTLAIARTYKLRNRNCSATINASLMFLLCIGFHVSRGVHIVLFSSIPTFQSNTSEVLFLTLTNVIILAIVTTAAFLQIQFIKNVHQNQMSISYGPLYVILTVHTIGSWLVTAINILAFSGESPWTIYYSIAYLAIFLLIWCPFSIYYISVLKNSMAARSYPNLIKKCTIVCIAGFLFSVMGIFVYVNTLSKGAECKWANLKIDFGNCAFQNAFSDAYLFSNIGSLIALMVLIKSNLKKKEKDISHGDQFSTPADSVDERVTQEK